MTSATVTYAGVSPHDGRVLAFDHRRIVFGPLAVGLGGTLAAGAMAASAVFAASWLLGAGLSGYPAFHARSSVTPATIAVTGGYRRLAGTADFAGAAPLLTARDRRAGLVGQARLAAAPQPPMPVVASAPPSIPRQSIETADNAPAAQALPPQRQLLPRLLPPPPPPPPPLPRPRPTRAIAHALQRTQVAALTPPTPAIIPPAGVLPLPAEQSAVQPARHPAPPILSPPPRTARLAKTEARHEDAPAQPKQSARLVTGSLPPPETSPNPLTVQQVLAGDIALPGPDSSTAVYDIAAHTVYMPGGQQLEAHSGLRYRLDNPRYASQKMRGPTPPNIYELTLRERLFHGVRAIRLTPVDEDVMHGRDGMLAHTYMLGPSGQSFGCVSFKDYKKFLHAFMKGEVKRLVVVPRLKTRVTRAAPVSNHHYAFNAEN